jgi:hypothetical protein
MGGKCKNKMTLVSLELKVCAFFGMELPPKMPFEFVWLTRRWSLPCTGEDA